MIMRWCGQSQMMQFFSIIDMDLHDVVLQPMPHFHGTCQIVRLTEVLILCFEQIHLSDMCLGNFIHIFVCTKLVHPEYLKIKHQLMKDFNVSLDLALVKDYHRRPYPLPLGLTELR